MRRLRRPPWKSLQVGWRLFNAVVCPWPGIRGLAGLLLASSNVRVVFCLACYYVNSVCTCCLCPRLVSTVSDVASTTVKQLLKKLGEKLGVNLAGKKDFVKRLALDYAKKHTVPGEGDASPADKAAKETEPAKEEEVPKEEPAKEEEKEEEEEPAKEEEEPAEEEKEEPAKEEAPKEEAKVRGS